MLKSPTTMKNTFKIPQKAKKQLHKLDKMHKSIEKARKQKVKRVATFFKNIAMEDVETLKNEFKLEPEKETEVQTEE